MQALSDPDVIAPGGRLGEGHGVFGFEADFAADLHCIPMVVRFKLDRVGIKLSLKQWSRIGVANRQMLAALHCDTIREVSDYRRLLVQLVAQHAAGPAVELALDPSPSWADTRAAPAPVILHAALANVAAPTPLQWQRLSTLQRFALVKLTRSNHDNENFVPAMREFNLV